MFAFRRPSEPFDVCSQQQNLQIIETGSMYKYNQLWTNKLSANSDQRPGKWEDKER